MVAGLALFFSPITTILGYIPLVGGVLSGIVGFVIILAAIIICIPLYLLTVAISWLCFHPKIGLVLLGIAIAATVLVIVLTRKKGEGGEGGVKAAHTATDHIRTWP